MLGYNDITPRVGAAYDVFGNGKTAVKVNVGKYLQAATNDENYWANNPAGRIVTSVLARGWVDGNGNYVVDCNLSNPALQDNRATGGDQCAALTGNDLNFGNSNPNLTTVNPAILQGWGIRPYDWQFGATVQQELAPRVSLTVAYNRRWFGNFFVTDNLTTKASDYDKWTLHGAAEPGAARERPDAHVLRRQPGGQRSRPELPDVRDRLRAGAHAVLARRGRQPERAAAQRRHDLRAARRPAVA